MSVNDSPPPFSGTRRLNFDKPTQSDSLRGCLADLQRLKGYSKMADELKKYIDRREDYIKNHQGEKIFISDDGTFLEKERTKQDFKGPYLILTIGAESLR